jgi:hypothetical protein
MSEDRAPKGSQSRGKHEPTHNKVAGDKLEGMKSSKASSPKDFGSKKPQKAAESFEVESSQQTVLESQRTVGPEALDERIQRLDFRDKGKEPINVGSNRGAGFHFDGDAGRGASEPPDILLVVDLNSGNPTAAFNAPALGYSQSRFLPAFKALSKEREAFLTSTKSGLSSSQFINFGEEWKKDFLKHCKTLLQSELGKPLENFNLQVLVTARGDALDRNKAMLLEAVKDAGFIIRTDDAVQIFSTVEAATIQLVRRHLTLSHNSNNPKDSHNILVFHYDGDVAEIQSYSVSWTDTAGKSTESQLRLEEMVYGDTVDCGKLVDHQFTQWIEKSFGSLVSNLSANNTGTYAQLMAKFTETRRGYKIEQSDLYEFPLMLQNPPRGAPYDSSHRICNVRDSEMQEFFEPAIDSLLKTLDDHHARLVSKSKTIDQVIFAGADCISPYVEDLLKDWGIGVGLLNTNIQAFPVILGRYARFETT